jgi:predicted dehydrogenase
MAVEALNAGKHVLCDKPFAMNVAEAEEMIIAARAHPKQLALVDHEMRLTDIIHKAREEIVAKSTIGKVVGFDISGILVKNFADPWSWWDSKDLGGGILGAIGSHIIDTIRFISNLQIAKVGARLSSVIKSRKVNGEDKATTTDYAFNVNCVLESGAEGMIKVSTMPYGSPHYTYRIIGEKGVAVLDLLTPGNHRFGIFGFDGRRILEIAEPGAPKEVDDSIFARGTAVLGHRLAALFSGDSATIADRAKAQNDLVQFEEGLYVQRVMDACHASNDANSIFVNV